MDAYGHVDAGMRIAAGSPKALAQVGIIVNPALQLAVGHLRIECGKVTLGQLGAAIGTDGKCFHRMNSVFVFTDVKILKIKQSTIHRSNYNQRLSTLIHPYLPLPAVTDFPGGGGCIFVFVGTHHGVSGYRITIHGKQDGHTMVCPYNL